MKNLVLFYLNLMLDGIEQNLEITKLVASSPQVLNSLILLGLKQNGKH